MLLFSLFIPSHNFSIRLRSWLWFSHPRASTVLSLPLLENKSSMKLQLSCRSAFPPWSPCISLHAFTLTSLPKTYCRGACTQSFWSDKKPPPKTTLNPLWFIVSEQWNMKSIFLFALYVLQNSTECWLFFATIKVTWIASARAAHSCTHKRTALSPICSTRLRLHCFC